MSNEVQDDYGVAGGNRGSGKSNVFKFGDKKVGFWKAKAAGPFVFDILQRRDNTIGYAYRVHRGVGPNRTHDVLCLRQFDQPCPVCDAQKQIYDDLVAQGTDAKLAWKDKKVKALFPVDRIVYNIIDVKNKEAGIQLMDVSAQGNAKGEAAGKSVQAKIASAAMTHKAVNALSRFPYGSPTEGSSVVATLQESSFPNPVSGKETKFFEWSSVSFINRQQQYAADLINQVLHVEEFFNKLTYSQIEDLMYGSTVSSDETPEYDSEEETGLSSGTSAPAVQEPVQQAAPVQQEQPTQTIGKPATADTLNLAGTPKPDCPQGGVFGKHFDKFDECTDCSLFSACGKESKRLKQAAL